MNYPAHINRASSVWYPLPAGASIDVAAYIDGLFEDEIRGWVVDAEQPARMITVCIRINGRFAGKVSACQYRPDLVPLFESSGIHGFAFRVPDRFFDETAWNVEVLLEDGRALSPRPLEIANPAAASGLLTPVRSPCLLFIHIPKTAGTALRNALTQQTHLSRRLLLYPNAPGFPGEFIFFLTESQLANLEYVYGHFGFRLHQFMPQPCEYATVLREPVARTLSHFMQISRTTVHLATISPDEFFSRPLTVEFDNLMTRLVSGQTADILPVGAVNEHVLEHAIDNLHSWFCHVGLQECADDSQAALANRLGLPATKLETENVSDPRLVRSISASTLSAIRGMNEYDIRLYEYVRNHFWKSGRKGWLRNQPGLPRSVVMPKNNHTPER